MVNNNNDNSTNHVLATVLCQKGICCYKTCQTKMSKLVDTMTTVVSGRPASPPIHTRLSDTKYFDRNHSFFDTFYFLYFQV